MMRWCWLFLAAQILSGCAIFSGGGNDVDQAAELTKIQETVKLKQRWKASVGGDDKRLLNLIPAYQDGRIYVSDYRGRVQALDAVTGKRVWKTDADVSVSSGPGVGEGVVLLGTSDGEVVCLSAEDGRKLWTTQVTSEVLSIPRAASGIAGIQTQSGDLIGLAITNGERRWIYDRSVPTLSLRGAGSPALSDGLIVGGFASGKLSAIAISNGRMAWETSIAVPKGRSELARMVDIDASPQIRNGAVFSVSYQGKIAALELETGRIIWARDMSSSAGLRVDRSQIYVADEQSNVLGLAQRNGALLWKQEGLHNRNLTAPTPFASYVAVGDAEGYLHLLSQSDGDFVGRVRVDRKGISAAPFAVNDLLYVLGRGGVLVAYEAQNVTLKKKKKKIKKKAKDSKQL